MGAKQKQSKMKYCKICKMKKSLSEITKYLWILNVKDNIHQKVYLFKIKTTNFGQNTSSQSCVLSSSFLAASGLFTRRFGLILSKVDWLRNVNRAKMLAEFVKMDV